MARWTTENTEGFTATELDTMNAAQETLEAMLDGVEAENIADLLNNSYVPGVTVDQLVAKVSALTA